MGDAARPEQDDKDERPHVDVRHDIRDRIQYRRQKSLDMRRRIRMEDIQDIQRNKLQQDQDHQELDDDLFVRGNSRTNLGTNLRRNLIKHVIPPIIFFFEIIINIRTIRHLTSKMINYYQRLGVTPSDSMGTIRKQYYRLAKECHPDKYQGDPREPHKCEEFKHLSEAYSALSNPRKRYLYDIQYVFQEMVGDEILSDSFLYHFSDDDLDLLHSYYETLTSSTEFRLIQTLWSSLPTNKGLDLKRVIQTILERLRDPVPGPTGTEGPKGPKGPKNQESPVTTLTKVSYRTIQCKELYEDYEITLKRPFLEVYHNRCKEILIHSQSGTYHVFVTHSDYRIVFRNGLYNLTLHLVTDVPEHLVLNGGDIYFEYPINLYQYFFDASITISLPSGLLYPAHIRTKGLLENQGLRTMDGRTGRGRLCLIPKLGLSLDMPQAHLHRELLKTIFTINYSSTKQFVYVTEATS
jgi:DnaJ-domain-containing protein 1